MAAKQLPPWSRADCDECGADFLATRTEGREFAPGTLVCGDCEMYRRGWRGGDDGRR
jgi:hypothetical protein